MASINAAIIGSGNIGTDLMYKALRSSVIKPVWMVGIDANSQGINHARTLGLKTTSDGIDGLMPHLTTDQVGIAFDATSAYAHPENGRKLLAMGIVTIDLTPAALGPFCVPPVNLAEHANK